MEKLCFWIFVGFVAACGLWGGGSRLDVGGLVLLQPLSLLVATAFLLISPRQRLADVRVPLLLLGALALLMAAQLIPLPPAIWTSLPGHARFAELAPLAGIEQPWRPISLTPDLTLASLVGLIAPLTALLGFAALSQVGRARLLGLLLIVAGVSAVFGLAQIGGGSRSPFYLYAVTNSDSAVGLFANRNHQAVLIAATLPMLALWWTLSRSAGLGGFRAAVALGGAIALLPLLIVTGSRAGLLLALVGLGFAIVQLRGRLQAQAMFANPRARLWAAGAGVAAMAVAIGATVFMSRDEALQRLLTRQMEEEGRLVNAPTLFEIARDFFPLGSGFGSFDPVFRYYEPLELLNPAYLNHAHNDLFELVITGGVPALLILAVFLVWAARRAVQAFREIRSPVADLARLGATILTLLLLSSLVDYPLRTPLMAVIAAICCGWLAQARPRQGLD